MGMEDISFRTVLKEKRNFYTFKDVGGAELERRPSPGPKAGCVTFPGYEVTECTGFSCLSYSGQPGRGYRRDSQALKG